MDLRGACHEQRQNSAGGGQMSIETLEDRIKSLEDRMTEGEA